MLLHRRRIGEAIGPSGRDANRCGWAMTGLAGLQSDCRVLADAGVSACVCQNQMLDWPFPDEGNLQIAQEIPACGIDAGLLGNWRGHS